MCFGLYFASTGLVRKAIQNFGQENPGLKLQLPGSSTFDVMSTGNDYAKISPSKRETSTCI
jgi:hypothetical protein